MTETVCKNLSFVSGLKAPRKCNFTLLVLLFNCVFSGVVVPYSIHSSNCQIILVF